MIGTEGVSGSTQSYIDAGSGVAGISSSLFNIGAGISDRIRQRRRDKKMDPLQMDMMKAQTRSLNLASDEEERKQMWSRDVRRMLLRGGR